MTPRDATLFTIEQRVRDAVKHRLRTITRAYLSAYHAVLVTVPGATGVEVTAHPELHRVLTVALTAANDEVEGLVRAGWRAAAAAARSDEDRDAPAGSEFLEAVVRDVRQAFAEATTDITNSVAATHDAVTGHDQLRTRSVAVGQVADRAVRRLGVRLTAAASTAVHRGYTDTQLAGHADTGYGHVRKRWVVTSDNPCPACAALDGELLDLDEEFDHTATDHPDFTPPRVYRDLTGPPRHPNCRCRLDIEPSEATAALRREVARTLPGTSYRWVTAAEIRRMPEQRFRALLTFLTTINTRLTTLLRRVRDGH